MFNLLANKSLNTDYTCWNCSNKNDYFLEVLAVLLVGSVTELAAFRTSVSTHTTRIELTELGLIESPQNGWFAVREK